MNQANNSFRETAAALAAKLQHADHTAGELTDELQVAHAIILATVRESTQAQKASLSITLIANGITADGLTRHHERQDLISHAKYFAKQNWSVQ